VKAGVGGPPLLDALRAAVGEAHVLLGADAAGYEVDWTGRFAGTAAAVVRPGSTEQVVAVVRACATHGVPVVPRGGGTGLVGGAVPRAGAVVCSLERLTAVGDVDPTTPSVVAGAGATLAAVDAAAARHGLAVGVDLAARDAATVGGMVATDAGGTRVVAHGTMRRHVLAVRAVLADGSVVGRVPGLVKDAGGYDLAQLLAGSEGTLGIITAVHLRLVPRPAATTTAVVGCGDVADVLDRVAAARRTGPLLAAELLQASGVRLVAAHLGVPPPLPEPLPALLLLLEVAGTPDDAAVAALVGGRPAAVALDAADARRLRAVREGHAEAVQRAAAALGRVPRKLDVTVPPGALADVLAELDRRDPAAVAFGHVADGTLHVALLGAAADEDEAALLRLVADAGGSIASEHGVGAAKAHLLHLIRTPAEVAALRALKRALDPEGLLNPGVLLPPAP
jgi:FAD/FMN-containing dehydrogenase